MQQDQHETREGMALYGTEMRYEGVQHGGGGGSSKSVTRTPQEARRASCASLLCLRVWFPLCSSCQQLLRPYFSFSSRDMCILFRMQIRILYVARVYLMLKGGGSTTWRATTDVTCQQARSPASNNLKRQQKSDLSMAPNLKMMGVTVGLAFVCNTFLSNENSSTCHGDLSPCASPLV